MANQAKEAGKGRHPILGRNDKLYEENYIDINFKSKTKKTPKRTRTKAKTKKRSINEE